MKKVWILIIACILLMSLPVYAGGDKNQIKNPQISVEAPSFGELNPDPYRENH